MKKYFCIPLLIFCLLQSGGIILIYQFQQFRIQCKMQLTLNDSQAHFEKIRITQDKFKNGKINESEVIIDEKLYDFRSVKISGNYVELEVINDTHEEGLLSLINKTLNNDTTNKDRTNHLLKLIGLTYINHFSDTSVLFPRRLQIKFLAMQKFFVSHITDISTPPPQTV